MSSGTAHNSQIPFPFEWELGLAYGDTRRRLTIDSREYDVIARCGPDGIVGIRLTGRETGGAGCLTTEMVGEVPAVDRLDVGTLLAGALAGFRTVPSGWPS